MSRQAIALLVHQEVQQINKLIKVLATDFDLYVHLDSKSDIPLESINSSNKWRKYNIN